MNTEAVINYTIGILGLVLAVVGIYLTVRSNKKKEPTYSVKSNNVISRYSSKYENLTVAYKGEKVENFTVSKILFYNRGTETIHRTDITTRNQIRVSAADSKILDVRVLQVNNLSSDFKVNMDRVNEWAMIDFEYLDKNQGAVFEIIHTGTTSKNLALHGDIKGVQKITELQPYQLDTAVFKDSPRKEKFQRTSTRILLGPLSVIITLLVSSLWVVITWDLLTPVLQPNMREQYFKNLEAIGRIYWLGWVVWLVFTPVMVLTLLGAVGMIRDNYKIPEGLENFRE